MDVRKYPVDYETVQKGDVIASERLEYLTGKKAGTNEYRLAVMAIRDSVERELIAIGRPMTIVLRRDEIVFLTDAEATDHCDARFKFALRHARRSHVRMQAVDTSQLTDDAQRTEHANKLSRQSYYVQAITEIKKKLIAAAHKRQTPGLLEAQT